MTIKKFRELEAQGKIILHHTASRRGYVSRKSLGQVEQYNGRFGKGYVLLTPRWDTSTYCNVTYYIWGGKDTKK